MVTAERMPERVTPNAGERRAAKKSNHHAEIRDTVVTGRKSDANRMVNQRGWPRAWGKPEEGFAGANARTAQNRTSYAGGPGRDRRGAARGHGVDRCRAAGTPTQRIALPTGQVVFSRARAAFVALPGVDHFRTRVLRARWDIAAGSGMARLGAARQGKAWWPMAQGLERDTRRRGRLGIFRQRKKHK